MHSMGDYSDCYMALRLGAALVSCAITSILFIFFGGGCWKFVYVMLTFICFCLYLIFSNTNSWFKDRKQYKDILWKISLLSSFPSPQFLPLLAQLTTGRISYAYTLTSSLPFLHKYSSAPILSLKTVSWWSFLICT